MKKITAGLLGAALAAVSVLAHAHTHLEEAQPADGSVLNTPPSSITLKFSEETQVTALTLQKDGGAERKLPLPAEASKSVSVAAGELGPGTYVVSYRVVGDDNHIVAGKVAFTVDPAAIPSAGEAAEHPHGEH